MDLIEVSEEDKKGIIDYYSSKISQLKQKIEHYTNLISKLNIENDDEVDFEKEKVPTLIDEPVEKKDNILDGFTQVVKAQKKQVPRQNWKYLCLSALKDLDKLSTTNDLYDVLVEKSPVLKEYEKGQIISKISTALSNLFTKKTIFRINNNLGRGYFWSLPNWYENNEIKTQYKIELIDRYGVDEISLFGSIDVDI